MFMSQQRTLAPKAMGERVPFPLRAPALAANNWQATRRIMCLEGQPA